MKESIKETAILSLTAGRLLQAADYVRRVKAGKSIKGVTAAIVGVDLADGIIARKTGTEGPKRRALDSAVDSTIIASALFSHYRKHPKARGYIGMLAAREVFVASGWAIDLMKTKQVKKGDGFHKLPSLSIAAFGLAAHSESKTAMRLTGALAISINLALGFDYFKGWTDPSRNKLLDNGVEEVPGFYDTRIAMKRLVGNFPQLTAGPAMPQLETFSGEVIEGTCIELPDEPVS